MTTPVIAVFGATGAQGCGLARALAALGVEICQADADGPASLAAAFSGADAAGQVQGAEVRRQWRSRALLARSRRAHHLAC